MIYLSTAIGLTPDGSVTVHTINTQNNTIITEQHNNNRTTQITAQHNNNRKTIAHYNDNYF